MPAKIEISHRTIIFTVLFLIMLWLLIQVKEIIFLIAVSFILMSALKPWTDNMENHQIPRVISILVIYILFITILIFAGSSIIPPLISQTVYLGENFPGLLKSVLPFIQIDNQVLVQQIAPISQNIFKATIVFFNNIVALFSILVISFYLLLERKNFEAYLISLIGQEAAKSILEVMGRIEKRLGSWVRAQVTLMLVIGLATFIGLVFLGIPYALPLAIFAGILEIVPTIGPIISAIPAILIALTSSSFLAIVTLALYFFIQQAENHLVVPLVMKQTTGLPPLITLIAIMIGAKLAGIIGAILAVPVVLIFEIVILEYLKFKDKELENQ